MSNLQVIKRIQIATYGHQYETNRYDKEEIVHLKSRNRFLQRERLTPQDCLCGRGAVKRMLFEERFTMA